MNTEGSASDHRGQPLSEAVHGHGERDQAASSRQRRFPRRHPRTGGRSHGGRELLRLRHQSGREGLMKDMQWVLVTGPPAARCEARPSRRSTARCEMPPDHQDVPAGAGFHCGRTRGGYWKSWLVISQSPAEKESTMSTTDETCPAANMALRGILGFFEASSLGSPEAKALRTEGHR